MLNIKKFLFKNIFIKKILFLIFFFYTNTKSIVYYFFLSHFFIIIINSEIEFIKPLDDVKISNIQIEIV
jgi:hypothetical protein